MIPQMGMLTQDFTMGVDMGLLYFGFKCCCSGEVSVKSTYDSCPIRLGIVAVCGHAIISCQGSFFFLN